MRQTLIGSLEASYASMVPPGATLTTVDRLVALVFNPIVIKFDSSCFFDTVKGLGIDETVAGGLA